MRVSDSQTKILIPKSHWPVEHDFYRTTTYSIAIPVFVTFIIYWLGTRASLNILIITVLSVNQALPLLHPAPFTITKDLPPLNQNIGRQSDIVAVLQPGLQRDRLSCKKLSLQKMFVTVYKSFFRRKTILIWKILQEQLKS